MKTILKISLLFLTINIYAQASRVAQSTNGVFNNNLEFFALLKVNNKTNNEFGLNGKGEYYLKSKWSKCEIKTTDGKNYIVNKCNYNIFDKRFEILFDNEILFLKKEIINKITIDNQIFKPISSFNSLNHNYYEEISKNNENSLIKLYNLKKKTIPSKVSLGLYENTVEVKSKKYFILNKKFIKVPKSRKKILKLLNKETPKKFNPKKTKDLVNLLQS